jgi:hypothetical protein
MKVLVLSVFAVFLCGFGFIGVGCSDDSDDKDAMCGNSIAEDAEVCDGEDLRGETCVSQGYENGTMACLADCSGFLISPFNHVIPPLG